MKGAAENCICTKELLALGIAQGSCKSDLRTQKAHRRDHVSDDRLYRLLDEMVARHELVRGSHGTGHSHRGRNHVGHTTGHAMRHRVL